MVGIWRIQVSSTRLGSKWSNITFFKMKNYPSVLITTFEVPQKQPFMWSCHYSAAEYREWCLEHKGQSSPICPVLLPPIHTSCLHEIHSSAVVAFRFVTDVLYISYHHSHFASLLQCVLISLLHAMLCQFSLIGAVMAICTVRLWSHGMLSQCSCAFFSSSQWFRHGRLMSSPNVHLTPCSQCVLWCCLGHSTKLNISTLALLHITISGRERKNCSTWRGNKAVMLLFPWE